MPTFQLYLQTVIKKVNLLLEEHGGPENERIWDRLVSLPGNWNSKRVGVTIELVVILAFYMTLVTVIVVEITVVVVILVVVVISLLLLIQLH